MSNEAINGVSMGSCLQDMPYEILFEVFRRIPKNKLIEISRLCSNFRDIAGDIRFWKDVCVIYESYKEPKYVTFDFEELYSEPWPVREIHLNSTRINPPLSPQIGQIVKVNELNLFSIEANQVTIEAILAKYQCTKLYMDIEKLIFIKSMLSSEAFPKQTDLEVLFLANPRHQKGPRKGRSETHFHRWLAPVFSQFCKNLKILNLFFTHLTNSDYLAIAKSLPTSLEELFSSSATGDPFFDLLAKSSPNLKVLKLRPSQAKCPSLLKLKFLEVLHLYGYDYISDLYTYLVKFPALETIYIDFYRFSETGGNFEDLKAALEPHGVIVGKSNNQSEDEYFAQRVRWNVSKTV